MWNNLILISVLCLSSSVVYAIDLKISDKSGNPIIGAMVTIKNERALHAGREDKGYPIHGKLQKISPEFSKFAERNGSLHFTYSDALKLDIRVRKPGYKDITIKSISSNAHLSLKMEKELDPVLLASQYPSNSWVGAMDFEGDEDLKKSYLLQCGFCHQQGSFFMRRTRSEADWKVIINRMIGYGARPSNRVQKKLPAILANAYADLEKHPEKVTPGLQWQKNLSGTIITEWPIGDGFSQMHDMLLHTNGKVYVGDNIQDRIWEINPINGETVVYKVPIEDGDTLGGLFSGRLKTYPKYESYSGIHSFAESKVDGHIFITPSLVRRLLEFDPKTGKFIVHPFENGLYPHTLRIDNEDRVWFTLALSNQIGRFDRKTNTFKFYDLPSRSAKESFSLFVTGFFRRLMNWGFPMHWLPIDEEVSGMPLPYGIDVAPNGTIWFARLYADSIGMIDPKTDEVIVIDTPFKGPRRLRIDKDNHIWITAFPLGAIYRYRPIEKDFTPYQMPTAVNGVETPYSLNVDLERHHVWVNGTASDTMLRFDITKQTWRVFPLPRKISFTRDVEIAKDGSIYTSNGAFPSWQIEDGQPSLIRLVPSP